MHHDPIPDSPQPDPRRGHAVQYPLTEVAFFGTFNNRTSIMRDDAGVYWVGNRRFSNVNDAYDYAEAHHA